MLLAAAAVLLVLAAVYFVTPVKDIVSYTLLLMQIDKAAAANDTAAALDAASRLVYPEKYTEQLVPLYYAAGMKASEKLDCTTALDYFALCPGYADTDEQIKRCHYLIGYDFFKQKDYDKALECFTKCDDYYISYKMIEECQKMKEETELYGVEVDYELTCGYDNMGDVFRTIRVKNDNGTLKVTVFPQPPFRFRFSYMLSGVSDGKVKNYSSGLYNIAEEHTSFTGGSASELLDNDEQLVFGIGYNNFSFNSEPERKYTLDKDQVLAIARG